MSDRFIKVWSTLCVTHDECLKLLKDDSDFEYTIKPVEQIIELDLIEKFIMKQDFSMIVFTLESKIRICVQFNCENIYTLLMKSGNFEFAKVSDVVSDTSIYTNKQRKN